MYNKGLLGYSSSKTTEICTHVSKKAIEMIMNPIDDFFNKRSCRMIKEIYTPLYLALQFGGVNIIEYTQSLAVRQ